MDSLVSSEETVQRWHGSFLMLLCSLQHMSSLNSCLERMTRKGKSALRTFALTVFAHPYCARKFTCHVMHRVRALSTKINNDRADGHCYSFAWIWQSWTFSVPYFSFQKNILFTIISTLSKNEQRINLVSLKNFKIFVHGTWNPAILRLQGA